MPTMLAGTSSNALLRKPVTIMVELSHDAFSLSILGPREAIYFRPLVPCHSANRSRLLKLANLSPAD